jgi:flagellar export protein FliJ
MRRWTAFRSCRRRWDSRVAKFQFSLEKVLRWRGVELTSEEAKLKAMLQEQTHLQTLLAEVSAERSKLISSLGAIPDLRGDDLRTLTACGLRLRRTAENLAQQLLRCGRELAKQRRSYSEAKRRVRLLEELRDRRLQEWKYQEAALLEELASESFLANWNRERI